MNRIVPVNNSSKTEEDLIEVPNLRIDPRENNPKSLASKRKSSQHSKSQSYIDLIELGTTTKPSENPLKDEESKETKEKALKNLLNSSEFNEDKPKTRKENSMEKLVETEEKPRKNEENAIKALELAIKALDDSLDEKDEGLKENGENAEKPENLENPIENPVKRRNLEKKRTLRLDSASFLKKPLSPCLFAEIPIDKLTLMIDKENERYISQAFDFKFESSGNWLKITISNEFLTNQENFEIKIYASNDELPYKWELKDLTKFDENSSFFGKIYDAVDLNNSSRFSLKIVDYEALDLIVLHDFLYNVLILRYLTAIGGFQHLLKIHDIYIAEKDDIFTGMKQRVLVIVMENSPMNLADFITIRKQKQLKWKDEELLSYLWTFIEELQRIYVNFGWCLEINPQNVFYSLAENSLKMANFRKRSRNLQIEVNWSLQMKSLYSTILSMKTLTISQNSQKFANPETEPVKTEFSSIFSEILATKPEDFKSFEEKFRGVSIENLRRSNEHLVYEIYYVNEKKDNTENMLKNLSYFSKKYESLLQYSQAFDCYEKVIKYRQNELENNEKSFIKIKYYMGYIFFQTGYFLEATEKLKEISEVLAGKFPEEFELLVQIEVIFGMIEKQRKDVDLAIKHFENALQIQRKNGQLSDLKTSQILVYLGYLYDVFGLNLSQIKKAHRFYSEALNVKRAVLKNKYQNNLVNLINNLGIVSHKLEKFEQSVEFFEEVLGIEERSDNKTRVANAKVNIGVVYQETGNYEEALRNFEEALEIRRSSGGCEETKDLFNIYNNIATVYQKQAKFAEAIKYYKEALKLKESEENKGNLEVLLNNLASIYYRAGFYEKSRQFYHKSLNLKRNLYGVENPSIAFSLNNLGLVCEKLNEEQEALKNYEESLMIKKKFFSEKHVSIGQTLTNLMYLCSKLGYMGSAIDYGNQALEIKKTNSAKDYANLSAICSFLGNMYESEKKFQEAGGMYGEAMVYQRMVDDGSNEIAALMQKVAEISEILGENEKAIKIYDDALNIFKGNSGILNRNIGEIMCKIADIYHKIKTDELAKIYYEGAVKILRGLEEIDEELIQNIEDQIKKLKHFKNNNKIFTNAKMVQLMEEIQGLTGGGGGPGI